MCVCQGCISLYCLWCVLRTPNPCEIVKYKLVMDGWKSEKLKVGKAISHIDVYRDVPRLIGLKKMNGLSLHWRASINMDTGLCYRDLQWPMAVMWFYWIHSWLHAVAAWWTSSTFTGSINVNGQECKNQDSIELQIPEDEDQSASKHRYKRSWCRGSR